MKVGEKFAMLSEVEAKGGCQDNFLQFCKHYVITVEGEKKQGLAMRTLLYLIR